MVQPPGKTVWSVLKKLRPELPRDPAILPLGIYPKNTKTLIQEDTPMFIAALLTKAKIWKQSKCSSTGEWIKKMSLVYMCIYIVEFYSAIKRDKIMLFVTTWTDLEGIMLSEISQTEKDKYLMISLICGI